MQQKVHTNASADTQSVSISFLQSSRRT